MNDFALAAAADVLRRGGVVAHPTEGVWGLCCDPADAAAIRRLLAIKRRHWREGLILVAADAAVFAGLLRPLQPSVRELVESSWPGPVTWIVPHHGKVTRWVCGEHPGVALRVTAHAQFSALCRRFGGALVSTSANRSGLPPVSGAMAVRSALGVGVDYVLDGRLGGNDAPSTIVDASTLNVVRGDVARVPGLAAARERAQRH